MLSACSGVNKAVLVSCVSLGGFPSSSLSTSLYLFRPTFASSSSALPVVCPVQPKLQIDNWSFQSVVGSSSVNLFSLGSFSCYSVVLSCSVYVCWHGTVRGGGGGGLFFSYLFVWWLMRNSRKSWGNHRLYVVEYSVMVNLTFPKYSELIPLRAISLSRALNEPANCESISWFTFSLIRSEKNCWPDNCYYGNDTCG